MALQGSYAYRLAANGIIDYLRYPHSTRSSTRQEQMSCTLPTYALRQRKKQRAQDLEAAVASLTQEVEGLRRVRSDKEILRVKLEGLQSTLAEREAELVRLRSSASL